jgi:hypothetical protein
LLDDILVDFCVLHSQVQVLELVHDDELQQHFHNQHLVVDDQMVMDDMVDLVYHLKDDKGEGQVCHSMADKGEGQVYRLKVCKVDQVCRLMDDMVVGLDDHSH